MSKEDEKEEKKEKKLSESLKEVQEYPETIEIKDERGEIDLDLMTALSDSEYQKLAYCSKCKMMNPVKKGKCTVCGVDIQ